MKKLLAPRKELESILVSFRKSFLTVGLFSFCINLLMLVPSIYMLQVYDRVLMSRNETTLLMLTVIMLGLYVLMGLLEFARSRVLVRVSADLDMRLNSRVFTAAFENRLRKAQGNPGQALGDLTNVRQFLTGSGLFAFFDAPWTPIFLIIIFIFHPLLGLLSLVGAVLLFSSPMQLRPSHASLWLKPTIWPSPAAISPTTICAMAEVIEAMGMLDSLLKRWFERQEKFLRLQGLASDRAGVITSITKISRISLQSLILGAGALLAIDGTITPGAMIAGLHPHGSSLGTGRACHWNLETAHRCSCRLSQAGSTTYRLPSPSYRDGLASPGGKVEPGGSCRCCTRHPTCNPENINLQINPGEVIGVVGPSASGKSTLARLLVGVWPAASGKVRLDGGRCLQLEQR